MINPNQITGLILAGGRGSRMGNADKGLQHLHGEAMVAHVIKRLAPQVGTLMINANRNIEIYRQWGLPVLSDELEGFAGPLAGLQTGLQHCVTPYLITVPCDAPFLPDDLVARLGNALMTEDADIAVAVTGFGTQSQVQPVFALMKTSVLPGLNDYLKAGNRKIQSWHGLLKKAEVRFENENHFRNINTVAELQEAATQS